MQKIYHRVFYTILGPMTAICSDNALYLLEFTDKPNHTPLINCHDILKSIEEELKAYFAGTLKRFNTPIEMKGTEFQKKAWRELLKVPYGETSDYSSQAKNIGHEKAYRALANAYGKNKLAIIIPCHRIINKNGKLGGYNAGIERKKWLIEHEKKYCSS